MNFKKYHVSKNLFDYKTAYSSYLQPDGTLDGTASQIYSVVNYFDSSLVGKEITISIKATDVLQSRVYILAKINGVSLESNGIFANNTGYMNITLTPSSTSDYWRVSYGNGGTLETNFTEFMLNTGSTPQPYEPYSSEVWHDIPYYLHNTDTDTITSLPVDIYTDGQPIGANLFDISTVEKGRIDNGVVGYASATTDLTITGNKIEFTTDAKFRGVCGGFIEIPNGAESISFYGTFKGGSGIGKRLVFYNAQKTWLNADVIFGITDNGGTATIPSGAKFVRMSYTAQEPGTASISNFMLNTGSTALPYQPYAPAIIKGNMVQTGTPTSTTPITPSETGERTGNLLFFNTDSYIGGANFNVTPEKDTAQFVINKVQTNSAQSCTIPLSIPLEKGTYTLSVIGIINRDGSYDRIYIRDAEGVIVNYIQEGSPKTFTLANDTTITALSIPCGATSTYDNITVKIMLNEGSTALPYEPYGYKLDIKSGNTTTPVYLGETLSTREIKKLVFDGTEPNWLDRATFDNASAYSFNGLTDKSVSYTVAQAVCTHFPYLASYADQSDHFYQDANNVYFTSTQYRTLTDWKAYLAAQYAAGTPVTVWYVLATETTGIVNEPIRMIGDYADSVSVTNIPTTSGGIEFDVNTSLKPSEVDLTYHGWHPVQSVHEKSKNLFDETQPPTLTNKYLLSDGEESSSTAGWAASAYIPVKGEYVTLSGVGGNLPAICAYDSNMQFVRGEAYAGRNVTTISISGCSYVRFSYVPSVHDNIAMLNTGSTALPYEPYWT